MHGIVIHSDGQPAAGIAVSTGAIVTTTGVDGRFTLPRQDEWGNFITISRPRGYTAAPWWLPVTADDTTEYRFVLLTEEQPLPYEFLHVTDTHTTTQAVVDAGWYDTALYSEGSLPAQITGFFDRLHELAPDARRIMITGDLVDHGFAEEFEAYIATLATSPIPVDVIPGNHDHMNGTHQSIISRNNYFTHDGDPTLYEAYLGPRWYSFDVAGLHVVAMDWHSHEIGIDHATQNAWVRADLAQLDPGAPYILLFHDQPSGSIVDELPWQPVAAFSGHWHTSRVVDVNGTLHVNSPPTFFGGLDYSPPAFRHVTWDGSSITLRTETYSDRQSPAQLGDVGTSTYAPTPVSSTSDAVLWQASMASAGHRQSAAVENGVVFVGGQVEDRPAGTVEAFDVATGRLLWRSVTRSAVKTTPAPAGDVVIAVEVSGDLIALDSATGETSWRQASRDPLRRFAWGAPTVSDGIIYVGDQSDLRAIDVQTGQTLWHRTDLSPHHNLVNHAAPLIVGDLLIMGFWPTPTDPIGLDIRTGKSVWERSDLDTTDTFEALKKLLIIGTAAYDSDRDTILMPAHGQTSALDRATGRNRWTADHDGGFSPATPLVTPAGYLVTVTGHGIRMLDPDTGATIWDTPVTGDAPFPMGSYKKAAHPVIAPPILVEDHLLLPGLDGTIRSYTLDGIERERTQLASPIAAALTRAGDKIIAVGTDGVVLALDIARLAPAAKGAQSDLQSDVGNR
ncbi:PQQ-binding-like beta-propeller repeat protein [Cryobacterium sp. Y11]|uniref:outer membrane protein assembly factor BamB family protein n=1 Tax=Cryobacterium sp. Y11 TaxID=2045016 RepID=UPI001304B797|nr:PQQ-binding-like beta-propeller repeat protein [Cryobacterium sp. Y11]